MKHALIFAVLVLAVSVQAQEPCGRWVKVDSWRVYKSTFPDSQYHHTAEFRFSDDSIYACPGSVFVPEKCEPDTIPKIMVVSDFDERRVYQIKPDTACWEEEWELELRLRNMPEIVWDSAWDTDAEYDSVWYHIRRKVPCPVPDSTGPCDSLRRKGGGE